MRRDVKVSESSESVLAGTKRPPFRLVVRAQSEDGQLIRPVISEEFVVSVSVGSLPACRQSVDAIMCGKSHGRARAEQGRAARTAYHLDQICGACTVQVK